MNRPSHLRLVLSGLLALTSISTAAAQGNQSLGKMWTFENPPLAYLEQEYGFEPGPGWLDALRLASLRFGGGCSASFVSPKGLIMTNHHCARGDIAKVTPEAEDWVVNGFLADSYGAEVKLPGLNVQQLVAMEDVTEAMNEGIDEDTDASAVSRRRAANEKAIAARFAEHHPDLSPQVVSLHQGAVFQVYLYKVWSDIRLVCSPHLQTAHFGGDPDNFTYPRYSLDFTFCRAYENDTPADTSAHYFRWSSTGPVEGEVVFVTGNPGTTDRLRTLAQMEHLRDANYPIVRELIDSRLDIMGRLAAESPEQEQRLRTTILSYQNGQKAYRGYHGGLLDPRLMARKAAAEAEFKQRVQADPELRDRFGDAWDALEEISLIKTAFEAKRRFHTPGGSAHLARALEVVRAVHATDAAAIEQHAGRALGMDTAMTPDERAFFVDHLRRAGHWLPERDPYREAVLGERTPEQTAALLERSQISDNAAVSAWLEGGAEAVAQSDDPALRMARVLEPLLRANDRLNSWLGEQERVHGARIGRAMFACYGNKVSPDATFTLRFSDGRVAGFPYNGTLAPFRTTFYGLYGRHAEFDGREPFDLPQAWLDGADRIDMSKSVNFVSSNDIIGGNSGSPIVNAELEVVGLIFDGNIEMLANKFFYTDEVPRAVSVHVEGIMEALTKIYGADRVAVELLGGAGGGEK